ncbi:MAG: cyclodeaminase/cyclohydrolase family protein [Candidatus Omnitrophota bacterium]
MREFLNGTIEGYLKELAGRSSVPGGGSASALAGAIGSSLSLMALNYSIKPGCGAGLEEARARQEKCRETFSRMVDEDCRVFKALMEAIASGKDVQKRYTEAAAVPLDICRECEVSTGIISGTYRETGKKLLTDAGCAVHMLRAAFYSARLNVEINLKFIEDKGYVVAAREELEALEKSIAEKSAGILARVITAMKG